jgi:PLD-like domain
MKRVGVASSITVLLIGLLSAATVFAEAQRCFTPGEDCAAKVVQAIDGTQSELLVQAYGFTSPPILQAVVRAKERGVTVKVILDKINEQERYTAATFLKNHGIEPLIDDKVAIAHNKVMILDRRTVISGSFNFTTAAQTRNAENVEIRDDPAAAKDYAQNWQRRAEQSRPYRDSWTSPQTTRNDEERAARQALYNREAQGGAPALEAMNDRKPQQQSPRTATHADEKSRVSSAQSSGTTGGCGSRGGPGYRLANGKCASWHGKR